MGRVNPGRYHAASGRARFSHRSRKIVMRFCVPAAVLCASLVASAAAAAAPPSSPPAPTPTTAPNDSDAAAKHAKLTECLKEAKSRKLVGAEKTAFIKDCTSKP
jgi:hypothetical protein